jgi:hypothetical protein
LVSSRGTFVLFFDNNELNGRVADIGEFVPRYRRYICKRASDDVNLAGSFLILHLSMAAAYDACQVRRM